MKHESAFPLVAMEYTESVGVKTNYLEPGLTKLEWFAGMALIGYYAGDCISATKVVAEEVGAAQKDVIARACFQQAAAMLAESERRQK